MKNGDGMSNSTGKRLELLRENKGWTKSLVARKLGIKAVSTYANWEYGIRQPDNKMLVKIADLFDVSVDYLLGRTDDPVPNEKEQTFEEWLNDPETEVFFKDYLKAPKERKEQLREFWEFIKEKEKGWKPGDKQKNNRFPPL